MHIVINFGRQLFKIATTQLVFDYMLNESMKKHYMLNENIAEYSISEVKQNKSKKFTPNCNIEIKKHWKELLAFQSFGFKVFPNIFGGWAFST